MRQQTLCAILYTVIPGCGSPAPADDEGTGDTTAASTDSPTTSTSSGASTSGTASSTGTTSTETTTSDGSESASESEGETGGPASTLDCVTLKSFDGPDVPTNLAGDTYPSVYEGNAALDIAVGEGFVGNALRIVLDDAYAQIQFNPYDVSSRGFAREYLEDPKGWTFDTYNRLRFRLKSPTNGPALAGGGQSNMDVGQYVKTVDPPDPGSDEAGGGHPYNGINVAPTGSWSVVELNMHPDHWRGAEGGMEHGPAPYPTGERGYNYHDALTRFYIDVFTDAPPATFLLDEVEFCRDPEPENDAQVYAFVATVDTRSNRVVVTWDRHKDENQVAHEVRYAFEDIHALGWEAAAPAPNGTIVPPGEQGYNNMVYDTTELPLDGGAVLFIAVKPDNSDVFSQIEIPLD